MNNYLIITITIIIVFLSGITFGVLFSEQIIEFAKGQDNMIYSCHNRFNSAFYNCPMSKQHENATGLYCDGYLLCENLWEEEDE